MNDVKTSIIIPIYNLHNERLTNFFYTCKKIYNLIDKCEIIIAEQVSSRKDTNIKSFIQVFSRLKHIELEIGDVFNKSTIINRAFESTECDFVWIMDCDFYTDYEFIYDNIKKDTEFLRPFGEVVELTENETNNLCKTDYIKMDSDNYNSSSANGKYSFLVKSKIFKESGMMNENFRGWGFQDLDFIENRLVKCKMDVVDILAFHLYHQKAPRDYVNQNKLLYLGIDEKHKNSEIIKIKECITKQESINETTKNVNLDNSVKIKTKNIETHVNVGYYNSSFFKNVKITKKILAKMTNKTKRNKLGIPKIITKKTNFLFYYIEYIYKNYDNLTSYTLFTTDYFLKNVKLFDKNTKNNITNYLTNNILPDENFRWIGSVKKVNLKKSEYKDFFEFKKKYLGDFELGRIQYGVCGCFYINRDIVKRKPIEFYSSLLDGMKSWTDKEYRFFIIILNSFYLT
jgi:predicted glycosyltransferase involved in capsule biosynthesis